VAPAAEIIKRFPDAEWALWKSGSIGGCCDEYAGTGLDGSALTKLVDCEYCGCL
jgi:hypothetical protein